MTIFLAGGSRSGKSSLGQSLAVRLAAGGALYYVATMRPCDEEDRARIRRHVADRAGLGFETVECPCGILSCLERGEGRGSFLIDSVTALLTNEMFPPGGEMDLTAPERCAEELCALAERAGNAVFVSDCIFSDAALYDEGTEAFRRGLGLIGRRLAAKCDAAAEVCAGIPIFYKGGLPA